MPFPEPSSVPVPSVVVPSLNVTEPVGTTLPDAGFTVAVKVMLAPLVIVVAEAVNVVVVPTAAAEIVSVVALDVELASFASPL